MDPSSCGMYFIVTLLAVFTPGERIVGRTNICDSTCAAYDATATANEGCVLAAEISVEVVCAGAMLKCATGNGLACKVAVGCQDAATKGVVKNGAAEGCTYIIEKLGPKLLIWIRSGRDKTAEMERAFDALNSVNGIVWIEKKFR